MPNTISPNMSLILPTVGQEQGPNWALDLNSSLSLIDQHNHAPGSGVQITPAGLNINVDLPLQGNNLTLVKSVRFSPQLAPLSTGADIGCVYVSGADLYYNDTVGNQVRLTIAGAVNGTPGSIGGLVAPATVTYVPANQAYVFQSNVNTSGSIDGGPVTIRNNTAASNGITLAPPTPLPASYTITLPTTAPASTKIVTMDATGKLAANYDVDNSTLTISANNLKVANAGITQTQLANNSVGTNQIIDANVTSSKLAAGAINFSNMPTPTTYTFAGPFTSTQNIYIGPNTVNLLPYSTTFVNTNISVFQNRPILILLAQTTGQHSDNYAGIYGYNGNLTYTNVTTYYSLSVEGVEISRLCYSPYNGSSTSISPLDVHSYIYPQSFMYVPSSTGNVNITFKLVTAGTVVGSGSPYMNLNGVLSGVNLQVIVA